jgi:hypothetical protein
MSNVRVCNVCMLLLGLDGMDAASARFAALVVAAGVSAAVVVTTASTSTSTTAVKTATVAVVAAALSTAWVLLLLLKVQLSALVLDCVGAVSVAAAVTTVGAAAGDTTAWALGHGVGMDHKDGLADLGRVKLTC